MDRSKLKKFVIGTLVGMAGCVFAATFNHFSPATGVLVGNASSYVTTAATSSNIRSLWSGTCDNTTYLRGDGACDTPPGSSVTPAALTKTDDTNVTLTLGGTPATALLQSTSLTLGWSGQLSVPRGGTGASSLTGYVIGNGTSAFTASATIPYTDLTGTPTLGSLAALNTINGSNWSGQDLAVADGGTGASTLSGVLKGNGTSAIGAAASSDVISLFSGTCNSSSFLRGDGACAAPSGTGTVTSVGLTMPSGFSVSGSPVTSSGTLAVTTSLSGVIKGNGTGLTTAAAADVTGLWGGSCSSSTFLRGDGTCASPGGATVTTDVPFTPTCTGYAACPAAANSGHYSITGAITCVFISNFSGTSNATGLTVTIPVAARPVNNGALGQAGFAIGADNGTRKQVTWRLSNSGVFTFSNDALMNGTNFTASGRKALEEDLSVCYANS